MSMHTPRNHVPRKRFPDPRDQLEVLVALTERAYNLPNGIRRRALITLLRRQNVILLHPRNPLKRDTT